MKCYFSADGKLIHIGDWDYKMTDEKVISAQIDPETKAIIKERQVIPAKATNPLPAGAFAEEREVIRGARGGLFLATDYEKLRREEYPALADQLDALWKGGADADAMRAQVAAVKTKFPKA